MAITIVSRPEQFTPVYNPIRYEISSTNTAQSNFKYYVEVYVSGVGRVFTSTYDADPNNSGNAVVDIQRVLENYVTSDVDSSSATTFIKASNSYIYYEVRFGEQYGATGSIVTYSNLTSRRDVYAWNAVLSPLAYVTFDSDLYTMGMGGSFLTDRPNQLYFNSNSDFSTFHLINDVTGESDKIKINTYNTSGGLITTTTIANSYSTLTSYTDRFLYVNTGSANINAASPGLISNSVQSYDITIVDTSGVATSETYTYIRICDWKGLSPINVVFLNRLGGYDNFFFRLSRRKSSNISRDNYQQFLSIGYTAQDRGTTVYNSEITDKYVLTSDWISEAESIWLQQLIESPNVYIYESAQLIPMVVKNASYEIKIYGQDRLFNIELELEYANKRWTQRS